MACTMSGQVQGCEFVLRLSAVLKDSLIVRGTFCLGICQLQLSCSKPKLDVPEIHGISVCCVAPYADSPIKSCMWCLCVAVLHGCSFLSMAAIDIIFAACTSDMGSNRAGSYCINPATQQPIPIWAADYVLGSYGSGAIMAVPAHDTRDHAFATAYDLPIMQVVQVQGDNELPSTGVRACLAPCLHNAASPSINCGWHEHDDSHTALTTSCSHCVPESHIQCERVHEKRQSSPHDVYPTAALSARAAGLLSMPGPSYASCK